MMIACSEDIRSLEQAIPYPMAALFMYFTAIRRAIGKRESSFVGNRLDQVPAVAVEVFEDGYDAVRF